MMPRNRRPKVKEWVRPPFIACPECKQDTFGVLSIFDRHYTRRCTNCWLDKSVPLPALDKKIIYVDQFVISNIMKELDPDRAPGKKNHQQGFYRAVFEKLDRLSKLQLIVVPHSTIQDYESLVHPSYEKLKSVFRHLSHGVEFHGPELMFHRQFLAAFRAWHRGTPLEPLTDRDNAFTGEKRNAWMDRLRIELNYQVPGLADSLRRSNEARTKHIQAICKRWQQAKSFDYKTTFEGELGAIVGEPLRDYLAYLARFHRAQQQQPEDIDLSSLYPPESATLISHMLGEFPDRSAYDVAFARIGQFFQSDGAHAMPFARISAAFWTSIARGVHAGRSEANFPTVSMSNDIDMVAAYSPFCDAMFVDKEVFLLASQPEVARELSGGARMFSLREDGAKEFLAYLDSIEAAATPEHLEGVRIVYGADWPKPYWELLEQHKEKAKSKKPPATGNSP